MNKKIIIIGNSGSGKSTLASTISNYTQISHVDLDSIYWTDKSYRKPNHPNLSKKLILNIAKKESWIVEGTYSHLIKLIYIKADELIWLDLPIEECLMNIEKRNENTNNLFKSRTETYNIRNTGSSRLSHKTLWDNFSGKKHILSNTKEIEDYLKVKLNELHFNYN